MGDSGKKPEPPRTSRKEGQDKSSDRTSVPPKPQPIEDDFEDGDFATPKQDRHGDEDEPL